MRLLYAEDEKGLSEAVVDILTYHNYIVDAVYNGNDALYYATNTQYDGIILDIMMPGMDGVEVLKRLREQGCSTPIILLTAKSMVEDQVEGLNAGADDYLPKPFSMELLIARIRALLRRQEQYVPNVLQYGNVTLNQINNELCVGEKKTVLPSIEYKLFELLLMNQNRYFSSEELLCKVWGYDTETEMGTLWVYISYLRKNLREMGADIQIAQKRNVGYRLEIIDGQNIK